MNRQRYRLRAPSTGREVILEGEPGRSYVDRETGEPLQAVGKLLPLPPSKSQLPVGRREPALLQLVRPARPDGPQRVPDLRPPYGRAAPLSPLLPMRAARTATSLLCTVALAVGAAGCGGSEVDYQEVPGPPADVTIPSDTSSLGDSSASGRRDATPRRRRPPRPSPAARPPRSDQSGSTGTAPSTGTGTGTTGATGDARGTDSGGASAPAQEDSASNDTAPPAGSDAQQFEDFCAQNPGAC